MRKDFAAPLQLENASWLGQIWEAFFCGGKPGDPDNLFQPDSLELWVNWEAST